MSAVRRQPRPRSSTRAATTVLTAAIALLGVACHRAGADPKAASARAQFEALYGQHCAGCHGAQGKLGAAVPLNDPLFLAITTSAQRRAVVTHGRGLMPAFGSAHGGPLQPAQIDKLVSGMHDFWQTKTASSGVGAMRAYLSHPDAWVADPNAGRQRFGEACASCHGSRGQGTPDGAGRIDDPNFLALVSKPSLRRVIITGRPELDMPDFRTPEERGRTFRPLTPQDVEDIAGFLESFLPASATKLAVDGRSESSFEQGASPPQTSVLEDP